MVADGVNPIRTARASPSSLPRGQFGACGRAGLGTIRTINLQPYNRPQPADGSGWSEPHPYNPNPHQGAWSSLFRQMNDSIAANRKRGRRPEDKVFNASNSALQVTKNCELYWMHFLLGANLLYAWLRTIRTIFLQPDNRPLPANGGGWSKPHPYNPICTRRVRTSLIG